MKIENKDLEEICKEEVVALGLVDLKGNPHNTPVWVNNFEDKLYIFTGSDTLKPRYVKNNPNCMLAFDYAMVKGKIRVIMRGDEDYLRFIHILDSKYENEGGFQEFIKNSDVIFQITPKKIIKMY